MKGGQRLHAPLSWSACLVCGDVLVQHSDKLSCRSCDWSVAVADGVVMLGGRPTATEHEVERWTAAMRAAPHEALPHEPSPGDGSMRRLVLDLARADGVALLGRLEGLRTLVLDAGPALFAERLVRGGAEVVATESSLSWARFCAARLARCGGPPASVIWNPDSALPATRGSFDVVVVADQGEPRSAAPARRTSWPDAALVAEAAGWLSTTGRLFVFTRNRHALEQVGTVMSRRMLGARAKQRGAQSAGSLSRRLRAAGLTPSQPAYTLPSHPFPRFVVGNERGRALGLGVLLRDIIGLAYRHPVLGRLQPRVATSRSLRHGLRLGSALILVGHKKPPAEPPNETLLLSGWRPFGDHCVQASIALDGQVERYVKRPRSAVAVDKLKAEHEHLERARVVFQPEINVPAARLHDGGWLELEALRGRRLAAFSAEQGTARDALAVRVATALGAVAKRTRRTVRLDAVNWDPALLPEERREVHVAAERRAVNVDVAIAHGDLQPSNVIIAADGRVGFIDWEYLTEAAPAGFDLLFLLYEVTRFMRKSSRVDETYPFAASLRPALEAFLAAAGMDRQALEPYAPLFALSRELRERSHNDPTRARVDRARLSRLRAKRPDAENREHDRERGSV